MEKQTAIIQAKARKHIKIYLLSQLGLKNSEVAKLLGTNGGHVYNALKSYRENPEKMAVAQALISAMQ